MNLSKVYQLKHSSYTLTYPFDFKINRLFTIFHLYRSYQTRVIPIIIIPMTLFHILVIKTSFVVRQDKKKRLERACVTHDHSSESSSMAICFGWNSHERAIILYRIYWKFQSKRHICWFCPACKLFDFFLSFNLHLYMFILFKIIVKHKKSTLIGNNYFNKSILNLSHSCLFVNPDLVIVFAISVGFFFQSLYIYHIS